MHPLEIKIQRVIVENNLIDEREKLVIGVSGGPDSIALLNIFGSLVHVFKFEMVAAYLDHGLRPGESAKELEHVRSEAAKNGACFEHGLVDTRSFARQAAVSIEEGARQLRYEFFKTIQNKYQAQKVAVAHNADDQAEEVLLRLLRGSGRKGLSGMNVIRDEWLIRPLLGVSKDEILQYLQSKNITYCLDSSNSDLAYLRNRVRLELLPHLAGSYNPGIKKVLRQTATIFEDEEELLESLVATAYSKSVVGIQPTVVSLPSFLHEKKAIQRRIIEKVLLGLDGQPRFRQIEQILCLAKASGKGDGGQIHLARGLRGIIQKNRLIFSYPAGYTNKRGDLYDYKSSTFEVVIDAPGVFSLHDGRIVKVEYSKKVPSLEEISTDSGDWFDASVLSFPFKCRSRVPGDRFHPLGGPGSKKIGDFLGDLKVAKEHRNQAIILEKERQIAALLGLRIGQDFRVRQTTKEAVKITVQFPPDAN